MRTGLQQLYDKLYYGVEISYANLWRVHWCRKTVRGADLPPDFNKQFREKVRPFWKQFGFRVKPCWYKLFYLYDGTVDPRYVPDDIHHKYIVPYFDDVRCIRVMEDKNLHGLLFPNVKRPETVFRRCDNGYWTDDFSYLTKQEAYERCRLPGRYIIKPTRDTGEGLDIRAFSSEDTWEKIEEIFRQYEKIDYIVQRAVVQHPELARLNPSSVNTIRMVTMVENGEASILSTILRIGGANSVVDNLSRGGYQAIVRPDGILEKLAFTHKGGVFDHVEKTDTGAVLEGFHVPSWEKLCGTAKNLAVHLPHLKLIGWDFTVDEAGDVVLIEFNCDFGQNQENCGPTFGDRTEEILGRIFNGK